MGSQSCNENMIHLLKKVGLGLAVILISKKSRRTHIMDSRYILSSSFKGKMIKDRNNKSLCEQSMKMAVNIIKQSSFSIAKMSLGASGPPTGIKNRAAAPDSVSEPPLLQSPGSQRSEKPRSSSKPISFLMQPPGGENEASIIVHQMIHESDEMFAYYIRKVNQKNQNDFS